MTQKVFYSKKIEKILIIFPSLSYFKKIENGLSFLKKVDEKHFNKINKYLKTVFVADKVKYSNKLFTKDYIWMTGYNVIIDKSYDYKYLASLLIHETHHINQYLSGYKNYGFKAEKNAYLIQKKFLEKIKYYKAIEWLDKEFKNKWWKKMDKDKKGENYFNKLVDDFKNKKILIKDLDIKINTPYLWTQKSK